MGSSNFSVEILKGLAGSYEVIGVVTQPDKPAGRGKVLTSPPVKLVAEQLGINVFQPQKLKTPESYARLESWRADLFVVAAYGKILRQEVLDMPGLGCINVHASYLPRWRGASPIQTAILHGDAYTGVTIMKMDAGIDTGPELAKERVVIAPDEDSISLSTKLSLIGTQLLLCTLPGYLEGTIQPKPQIEEGATYAQMINKEDGWLDFNQPAAALERKVRAFIEWPGTAMTWEDQFLKIRKASVIPGRGKPGRREIFNQYPCVCTEDGKLLLIEVQPAGKKWMDGADYLRGVKGWLSEAV